MWWDCNRSWFCRTAQHFATFLSARVLSNRLLIPKFKGTLSSLLMNGCKNETTEVPLVHRKSTTGYTEMLWMKPFTSHLFLSSSRNFFFNRIKLSSSPLLRRPPIFPSYDICLKVAAEFPILSLFPATKTPSGFSLILFTHSTDVDTCDNFFLSISLCLPHISLAALIPNWCMIFVPLNINSNV